MLPATSGISIARRFLGGRRLLKKAATPWVCESCCRSYSSRRVKIADPASPARTRFAPSPTGFLHLGSLRTALFNYLLAKRTGGKFILRIEDTDQRDTLSLLEKKRTVAGAEEALFDILRWAGLQWDEGPEVGGRHSPYRQSERSHIHKEHAEQLLESGHAYRCFCSIDRLRALAEDRRTRGLTSEYDRTCTSISASESASRASAGEPHVIRLLVPDTYPPFSDAVYGRIKPGRSTIRHGVPAFEDPILIKQDGLPTYHLANVVDDHTMDISHVVRGIEWLPSTPKHVYMYAAFGWEPPTFCHVGLLQDAEGQKLSKRSGDVHVAEYRDKGYLPEALLNFVALLGWNNRLKSDILPLEELAEEFSIKDLTKGNTKVNFGKLDYLQKAYVATYASAEQQQKTEIDSTTPFISSIVSSIQTALEATLPQSPLPLRSPEYIATILDADLKNYVTPVKFVEQHDYFFLPDPDFDSVEANVFRNKCSGEDVIKGKEAVNVLVRAIKKRMTSGSGDGGIVLPWDEAFIDRILDENWEGDKESQRIVQRNLRFALTGGKSGPGIHRIMMILGEEEVLRRLENVRWYGRRGMVDEKGRIVMTWQEKEDGQKGKTEDSGEEEEMDELVKRSREF
ncbi:hypothetical protein ABW20_dc0105644 [Dactylellina cionopaga]|nr:hypothetical protein ABW20_dc0105644 [Dactylellina cionopaga]